MGIFKLMHIKERPSGTRSQGLKNALNYIFNPAKTEQNIFVGGIHCPTFSAQSAYNQMIRTKQAYSKQYGRQGYHFVLSFAEEEHVSPELCQAITQEIITKLFDKYETVFAVHTDQKHMHSHIVFNSVSYEDGHKYHYNNGDWKTIMMPVINEICRQHGLRELELEDEIENRTENKRQRLPHSEQEERKNNKYTMLQHIQIDIDNAIEATENYEDFIQYLRNLGYRFRDGVERHATLSLLPPDTDREKFIRTNCLGDAYMPAGIKKRLSGDWNIAPYKAGFIEEDDGELFATKKVSTNRKKHKVYRICRNSKFVPKEKYQKLSDFQKLYLRYYRYFSASAKTREALLWKNNGHILACKKMNVMICFMLRYDIRSLDDLKKYDKSAYQRKMTTNIEAASSRVANWNETYRKEQKVRAE